jgi:hypothetical protein
MNTAIEPKEQSATRGRVGRVFRVFFQEWVFQLALVFAVVVTLVDSVISIDRGTIV